jgi:hypothetical protein
MVFPELNVSMADETNCCWDLYTPNGFDWSTSLPIFVYSHLRNFSAIRRSYICSNIPSLPAYGVYISQLIRYARACSTYHQFLNRDSLMTNKLMSQGFLSCRLQAAFRNVTVITTIKFANIQPFFRTNAVWCVSYQSLIDTLILTTVRSLPGACFTKQLTITTTIWVDYKILQN